MANAMRIFGGYDPSLEISRDREVNSALVHYDFSYYGELLTAICVGTSIDDEWEVSVCLKPADGSASFYRKFIVEFDPETDRVRHVGIFRI